MKFQALFWIFSTFISICCALTTEEGFSYDGKDGVSYWEKKYGTCKGKHQSPININVLSVKKVKLPPLNFRNFHTQLKNLTLHNNGHTAIFTVDPNQSIEISGGPLKSSYKFSQFHFHWADNDSLGSEDTINGKHFPMELHMVFYKKDYKSQELALKHSDGLTVLAFFFSISHKPNSAYVEVAKNLEKVTKAHTNVSFEYALSLEDYIHTDLDEYYVYNGSLTTPPCLDNRYMDGLLCTHKNYAQTNQFRSLRDPDGNFLKHNFRPTQPIGDRIVWLTSNKFNKDDDDLHDGIKRQKNKKKKMGGKNCGCTITSFNHLTFALFFCIITFHRKNSPGN